jgi:hypothetical protein
MGRLVNDERVLPVRLNFWARYSWVAAAAAVLAFIILNPFTSTRESWKGPVAQKTEDEKAALSDQAKTSGYLASVKSSPSTFLGRETSHPQYAMARKAKVSKPKEAANLAAGGASSLSARGAVSGVPAAMVVASKPADKDQPEAETYSKRMEASEAPAMPQAFPAAAPPAEKKAQETMSKQSRAADAVLSATASSGGAGNAADVASNEPLESREAAILSRSGANSPFRTQNLEIVTDEPSFRSYWQALQPGQAVLKVDFSRQAVVVLLAGEKPTAGYSISMTALEDKNNRVAVHYRISSPPSGVMVAQILTRPWCLEVIPKPAKPVVFIKD